MGVRESVSKHPVITVSIVSVLVVGVLAFTVYQSIGGGGGSTPTVEGAKAFFSDDNGQTFFLDSVGKYAPFDHNGKPAYQAMVYSCDGGKTTFVGYLQRYTKQAHAKIEKSLAEHGKVTLATAEDIGAGGIEVKPPGTPDEPRNWSTAADPGYARTIQPRCPHGGQHTPELQLAE